MISVVFITSLRLPELRKAILSCINRSSEDYEVIVINNCIGDDIEPEMLTLAADHQLKLRYIVNAKNLGVAASRNQGFRMALGDIVYFLDDDAVICTEGNCISEIADFMRSNTKYAVVATEIYNTTGEFYQHGKFPRNSTVRTTGEVSYFIGASHFINKQALKGADLYPSEFFYGGEEYYLSFMLNKLGYVVFYYKQFLVYHQPSLSTRLSNEDIMINSYCNAFNVKRYFTPVLFIPLIWIVMLIRIFFKAIKHPAVVKKFSEKISQTYNRNYVDRMGHFSFIGLIYKYGTRTIL
ncbi:glycosyltransferase family 2 protein [Mucilaginibacter myungsuensis]|uniref:Glycosyltransferase family 2 protein n=1 Tax=Mucilaginibacter myungsuensis TaxID=649104 RepID=A0A929KVK5_9SPHI|nr:glycosyltransferase family 2 protein [Mucilaginibacter myungsuensis]MBE9662409.1 glycosyltransferase family 2 protein [Mucilaginibacter myungsuensis]MDN3599154.1 glycosyltransferase family 2 protein [Mucilaginibacter myungsuensis]